MTPKLFSTLLAASALLPAQTSAILFNVDGAGMTHWTAHRWLNVGPDGETHWDKLPFLADYRNHVRNALSGNSNAGNTAHAYGVKVAVGNSIGADGGKPLRSLAGNELSILAEAKAAGKAVGLVNSARLDESGVSSFASKISDYRDRAEIAKQVLESQPDLILAGGESLLLPEGMRGRHGNGTRKDGLNLIERARSMGYAIAYTREELEKVPVTAKRVLGVFAENETAYAVSEEELAAKGLPLYVPDAPTIAEMGEFAVKFLSRNVKGFLLVMNEEGSDNYAAANNAKGVLEATRRADDAIGRLSAYVARNPNALLLTLADAPSGGLTLLGRLASGELKAGQALPPHDDNGAPIDGIEGTGSAPFLAKPDRQGQVFPFAVSWGTKADDAGGVLAKAVGLRAELVRGRFDSTDVYRLLYRVLLGKDLPR
jgi:alkaline phosphatase